MHPVFTDALELGLTDFVYADLFDPTRLRDLHALWDAQFARDAPEAYSRFDQYRRNLDAALPPQAVSQALLGAAPHVSAFVARLFCVQHDTERLAQSIRADDPIWRFHRDFVKKRVLRAETAKTWTHDQDASTVALRALAAVVQPNGQDDELETALGVLALLEIDDVARRAAKAGGATWTVPLRERANRVAAALEQNPADDAERGQCIAYALDALETHLAARFRNPSDQAHHWSSVRTPKSLDYEQLVPLRRPDPNLPELFEGHKHHLRVRNGFALTDRRATSREVAHEVDYCQLCHDRNKDSCSKGLRDAKTKELKTNPLGVKLTGCPLRQRVSEMHAMRKAGDVLAALALVVIDNPMCAGTGHRICNDCMKACLFQKQEPVNIPQIETRVLTDTLALPWGFEIYGFLTRWNPLDVHRPFMRPYRGKKVLVVGLGPAGYTLTHHLACEGFGVVAIDGLKLEPLADELTGQTRGVPGAVRDIASLAGELDERVVMGFGGVSEYGITVRWDKNFLTLLYATLSRHPLVRMYGGVRFGGTLTLDDAWDLGFDHVAIAAGAGRPTLIDLKNNLSRGLRKASDFLMGLQLSGAYKASSLANLQIRLPAVVIGGGLTAVDAATELLAYYVVQIEKEADRYERLLRATSTDKLRAVFDDEELEVLDEHLEHARQLAQEKKRAVEAGDIPRVHELLQKWGGVTLVYRKGLRDSPAYRLNHEEVGKSLEEGVRYIEHASPVEALLDARGHVQGVRFVRRDGTQLDLPARTVCVAAGTGPNVTYEKEHPGTFVLDAKNQFFQAHEAHLDEQGQVVLAPVEDPSKGFFTSYLKDQRTVSYYGDNHPHYAGSVVKAMASAHDGYVKVAALFPATEASVEPLRALFARLDRDLCPTVEAVNRLTSSIVEIVIRAPIAARKFQPGQFYRLQNFESLAPLVEDEGSKTRLAMEGLALTGAWVEPDEGLLGTIVMETGGSSRLCALLEPGERVVLMGPTGAPTEIVHHETVLLCGGGLGNAVLFSIARAFKALGGRVLYFAGYKRGEDLFKQDDVERHTDQIVWCTDSGKEIVPRRPQDAHFRGNIVQALVAYGEGRLGVAGVARLDEVERILAIGSDRMMNAIREARHGVLAPMLDPEHVALGSINSPMQCMMKELCAQCLQKHRDPTTGVERVVFSCFNQDQQLDHVDFAHLNQRLRANSMQEKLTSAWLDQFLLFAR
jgi:NADPH-dependent glutamate synthase beta subunit-like oxidoreductase/NAD(P)H-flavin reductase